MKTIEEKAKRYDELKVIAQELEEDGCFDKLTLFDLFPELAESEDEKIIKDIVTYLKSDIANKGYRDKIIESWIAWLEKKCSQIPANSAKICEDEQKPIKEHNVCDFCEEKHWCVSPCPTKLIGEQKPVDFSDLRTWKYIVDAVWTEKEGIGQYLDSPITEEVAKKLQKRFGNIEQKSADTEKGANGNEMEIPNSAWSEEDEKFFKTALWHISYSISNGKSTDIHCDTTEWFKSLKDRVQPKQEWSEEDEKILDRVITNYESGYLPSVEKRDEIIKKLEFFKERHTWKPSEEQMLALNIAIEMEDGDILKSLYQDLLKLKEE